MSFIKLFWCKVLSVLCISFIYIKSKIFLLGKVLAAHSKKDVEEDSESDCVDHTDYHEAKHRYLSSVTISKCGEYIPDLSMGINKYNDHIVESDINSEYDLASSAVNHLSYGNTDVVAGHEKNDNKHHIIKDASMLNVGQDKKSLVNKMQANSDLPECKLESLNLPTSYISLKNYSAKKHKLHGNNLWRAMARNHRDYAKGSDQVDLKF